MWYILGANGATRDLWLHPTGDGMPEYGRWILPDGRDVHEVLRANGPDSLGIPVWWTQDDESSGRRLHDMLWDTSMSGLKLVSRRMHEVLVGCGASLRTFEVDIRLRRHREPVHGYVGVLEESHEPGPVHSYRRGGRVSSFVVSAHVRDAVTRAGLTGLQFRAADPDVAFPGDQRRA